MQHSPLRWKTSNLPSGRFSTISTCHSYLPRFEVVDIGGKFIGLGQGDNGDAAKINAMFMNQYVDGPLEFIYTTPDVDEEDIFDDHFEVIKSMDPAHVIVVRKKIH